MSKVKAHIRYRKLDGEIVPGVTTVTGSQLGWNKQILINWGNRIGLEGISASAYKDDKADIGKLGHAMVTDWLLKQETDTSDYSKNQIDQAENAALSFHEWAKGKNIEPVLIEEPLISEKHGFGGTADIYAIIDGTIELIDLKTGSGIYEEMLVQVGGGYRQLLIENKYKVERVRILNIPRAEDERFIEQVIGKQQCEVAWEIFLNCLANYQLRKKLNGR